MSVHQTAPDLGRFHSLLSASRRVSRALLAATTEAELYHCVCDALESVRDVRLAWVGLVDRETNEIRPVAHAGFEEGFLEVLRTRGDDAVDGHGPAGAAVRSGQPAVVRRIADDPAHGRWRGEALRRGYRSAVALPLVLDGEPFGTLNVYSEREDAFGPDELAFLGEVASDIGIGVRSLRLESKHEGSLLAMRRMLGGTVQAISLMGEMRDPYTAGHQRRVADLAEAMARRMGFSDDRIQGIHVAGLLHDVGKIAVPAEILTKPGRLSEYEFGIIKSHPLVGRQILVGVEFPWPVTQAVVQHHERLDGRGYPAGLGDEAIIPEARILAVADVVEAMSSHRPYRAALGIDAALEEVERGRGSGFDPGTVDACAWLFREGNFAFT